MLNRSAVKNTIEKHIFYNTLSPTANAETNELKY